MFIEITITYYISKSLLNMLRKIKTLDKAYFVNWTPEDVCSLLKTRSITASSLVQSNKINTNKLIIELLPAQHYIYSQSLNYWRSRLVSSPKPRKKEELH